jgi:hypothetical protein
MVSQSNSIVSSLGIAGILVVVLIAIAIIYVPMVFYLLTLQRALNRCTPQNRAMTPGLVWLMLIPLFNIIWHFFVVINIAKSLGAEFQKRGIAEEPNPGQKLGMVMCILNVCEIIPFLHIFCFLGTLVCWIMYWMKIAGFSNKLTAPAAS